MKSHIRSMLSALKEAAYNRYRTHLRRRRALPTGPPAPATRTPAPWRRKAMTLVATSAAAAALFAGGYELWEARVEDELEARHGQAFDRYFALGSEYDPARAAELKERGLLQEGNDGPFAYTRVASVNPPQAPELVRREAEVERAYGELEALRAQLDQYRD